jgi:hypothetical protein
MSHAAHTETGTNALISAVDALEGEQVTSVFFDDYDRVALAGASYYKVDSQGGKVGWGSYLTFTLPNDVDVLSKVFIEYNAAATTGTGVFYCKMFGNRFIDKVTIDVGGTVWETQIGPSMLARLDSESSDNEKQGLKTGLMGRVGGATPAATEGVSGCIPLRTFFTGNALEPALKAAHLQAAATYQPVKIKLYFSTIPQVTAKLSAASSGANAIPSDALDKCDLYVLGHILSNPERNQIRNADINRAINVTQSVQHTAVATAAGSTITVDLREFNLYASHLLIQLNVDGGDPDQTLDQFSEIELTLNGVTAAGKLPGSFLRNLAPSMVGLNYATLMDALYVWPFSADLGGDKMNSTEGDGHALALNRFENVKLICTVATGQTVAADSVITVTAVGKSAVTFSANATGVVYL